MPFTTVFLVVSGFCGGISVLISFAVAAAILSTRYCMTLLTCTKFSASICQ
jgi:hypothetical protein